MPRLLRFLCGQTAASRLLCRQATGSGLPMKFLKQAEAAELDARLFGEFGYSVEALMELAGQAVALAAHESLPEPSSNARILVVSGPGNNGGDGLVAARHLTFFGHSVSVLYPKESKNELMKNLVKQCSGVGVDLLSALPSDLASRFDLAVDAIFGFSFRPPIRAPFDAIIESLAASPVPVLSVDIPSDTPENGVPNVPVHDTGFHAPGNLGRAGSAQLALKVIANFDKVINKALSSRVKSKVGFKANHLRTYRFCDNVWTFVMENVEFKETQLLCTADKVKFVACDGRAPVVAPPPAAS